MSSGQEPKGNIGCKTLMSLEMNIGNGNGVVESLRLMYNERGDFLEKRDNVDMQLTRERGETESTSPLSDKRRIFVFNTIENR